MHVLRDFAERSIDADIRDEILGHLAHVPIFGELTREQLDTVAEHMEAREYEPNERIFAKGSSGDELHVILDGIVTLRDLDASGRERCVTTLGRGDAFGEIGFLSGQPRSLSACNGAEPGLQLVLSRPQFERVATRVPTIGMRVFEQLLHLISNRMKQLPVPQRNYLMWGYRPGSLAPAEASPGAAAVVGVVVALAVAAWLSLSAMGARLATPQAAHWLLAALFGVAAYALTLKLGSGEEIPPAH